MCTKPSVKETEEVRILEKVEAAKIVFAKKMDQAIKILYIHGSSRKIYDYGPSKILPQFKVCGARKENANLLYMEAMCLSYHLHVSRYPRLCYEPDIAFYL